MEEKKRIKSYLIIGFFSGIIGLIISILFLNPSLREIINPPLPSSSFPKNSDLNFTFYDILTNDTGAITGKYTVQVSASRKKINAKKFLKKLKNRGYAAYLISKKTPSGDTWYLIRVGYFFTKEEADQLARELKKNEKLETLVVKKKR